MARYAEEDFSFPVGQQRAEWFMMDHFPRAFAAVLKHETADLFVDEESGEISKYGITLDTYREIDPTATRETIEALTEAQARTYYRNEWWDRGRFDTIAPAGVAAKLFDLAVNVGSHTATRLLQKSMNILPGRARIAEDGIIGPKTAEAVGLEPEWALVVLIQQAEAHYYSIVRKNPVKRRYLKGWLMRAKDYC
jgi:lysozyme family protein